MAQKSVFQDDRMQKLWKDLQGIVDDTNYLRTKTQGFFNQMDGELYARVSGEAQLAQSQINRLADDSEQLKDFVLLAITKIQEVEQQNMADARVLMEGSVKLDLWGSPLQKQPLSMTKREPSSYSQDPLFEDPAVQKLYLQLQNGTEEEQLEAKEKLDAIFMARDTIARAQVAYATYKAFGNKYLMEQAHKEAAKQREKLKGYGVSEDFYGEKVNLSHFYLGTTLQACSYDPTFQLTKDGKIVQVPMPDDNQYQYLLGLVMKGGSQGAWAQKQLEEIHKLLSEIGRAQVAWNEYKAKGMQKEMDGAHAYAEKLRTQLKDKYSLSSEMVDDVDFKYLWTGTGFAGNALKPQDTNIGTGQSLDLLTIAQQVVFGNEGDYDTVVRDDGKNPKTGYLGGVSIGKLQWHESRAYDLLLKIMKEDMETAKKLLGENSKVYKELCDPILAKSGNRWYERVLTVEEKQAISKLISTNIGKKAQDEQAKLDMQGYLNAGKKLGITDEKTLIYFADLQNQSPKRAKEIVQDAGGGKGLTLEKIHKFALDNSVMGKYVLRRNTTFDKINNLTFENKKGETSSNNQQVQTPANPKPKDNNQSGVSQSTKGFTELPKDGPGFKRQGGNITAWGTPSTIESFMSIAKNWSEKSDKLIYYNDLSQKNGGDHPAHKSHETGTDIDIRPIRKDNKNEGGITWESSSYDRDATRKLIEIILKDPNVESIYFNDPVLIKEFKDRVIFAAGHHNHLHINFKK